MENNSIIISVIIPIYNTEEYLSDCLASVLSQTCKNIEIILVDDGSTDSSAKICDEFAVSYENIRVIHKKNGGASDARNCGITIAQGRYIHFLDSDDILVKEDIYEVFKVIINNCDPDIVFSRCKTFSEDFSKEIKDQLPYDEEGLVFGDILLNVLSKNYEMTLTSPVNKLFKKDFLILNDLFFTVGIDHEEDEWLPRVICKAKSAFFCNTLFYGVRYLRPNSLSETKNDFVRARKACSKIFIANSGMNYMNNNSLCEKTLSLITNYYWDYLIDACIAYWQIKNKKLKQDIILCIKNNSEFFDSYKFLKSKNRRILGMVFKHLGIKPALYFIKIRY